MGEEMIVGRNPVLEALKAGRPVNKIMISNQLNNKMEQQL